MKHYKTLMNALAGAMPVCMTWKLAGTEEGMNARDVYALALEEGGDDEQLPEQDFYVVSAEGAIGLTTRYEYLTRWIFIPVTGEEKEKEMERLRAELRFDQETAAAEAAAAEAAEAEAQAAAEAKAGAEAEEAARKEAEARRAVETQPEIRPAAKRFCTSCGKPLNPGAKFCRNCGAKVG
ncbi:MAG: zinc ribbon domain-containing protein [Lachnospiraceae bacterium]|nr:zinc ribbon domain-containing protein [Lachnospiraceae bacterium]